MVFGVGGDFDVKVIAGLKADELDQFVGVAQFARVADAGRQIAAQRDDAADAARDEDVPPAPKVTEKNSGFSTASFWRTTRSLSAPSVV